MAWRASDDTVTVLIPAYRPAAPFASTLQSLAEQTHPRMRVLISLDHAPDQALPELPALEDLTLQQQPSRLGWVGNVNWLLGQVETPYFLILGHDDCLSPAFIEATVSALRQRPEAIVAHGQTRHSGVREGEVAGTGPIRGDRLDRVLEFIRRKPHTAEMGWRGVTRSSAIAAGLRLRTRRSDGMFSNTLWALELLCHGESIEVADVYYDKYTHATHGLSRDYHNRTRQQKTAMLADNLACLLDVLREAGFAEAEQEHVVAEYAEWLLGLRGHWNVVGDQPDSDSVAYSEARPALARFIACSLVSLSARPG